jgi:hypothetical protein
MDRDWVVEPYRPGDETAIIDLFRSEFGRERSLAHWRWKFLENPYGGPFISLAWHREKRFLVGNQVLMPFQLSVDGRPVLGGHSLDLVVHHDFRRQGVFEQTALQAFETLRQAGGAVLVAFPNASSYPGFVRTLHWRRILEPRLWRQRLGVRRKLARVLRVPLAAQAADAAFRVGTRQALERRVRASREATPGFEVHHLDRLSEATDVLWERERQVVDLSLWKDRAYLAWRYEKNPDHRFVFHSLFKGETLEGLAVSTESDGVALLCELIVPLRSIALGRRLLAEISSYYDRAGADEIHFLGHDAGFYTEAFEGFESRPAPENVFVGRAIENEQLTARMAESGRWTLSYGDGDFV